jgi:hypothetical protein
VRRAALALAVALAIGAAPRDARAIGSFYVGGGHAPVLREPEGEAPRDEVRLRVEAVPAGASAFDVELELVYPPAGPGTPAKDVVHVGARRPLSVRAEDGAGRRIAFTLLGGDDRDPRVELPIPEADEGAPALVRLHLELPVERSERFGWRWGTTELAWLGPPGSATRRMTSAVVLPLGDATELAGYACAPGGAATVCTRTTKGPHRVPLLVGAPLGASAALFALVLGATATWWWRIARPPRPARKAPPPPAEPPRSGIYRDKPPPEPEPEPQPGPPQPSTPLVVVLATVMVGAAMLAAVSALADGRTPWPMTEVLATATGFVAAGGAIVLHVARRG